MAYTDAAIARRRCTATRKDGEPCGAWALWGDPHQRCAAHAGRPRRPVLSHREARARRLASPPRGKTRYVPCTCAAYAWPHRPGSGICRWPDPPRYRLTTPAGTHSWPRARKPSEAELVRRFKRLERKWERERAERQRRQSGAS